MARTVLSSVGALGTARGGERGVSRSKGRVKMDRVRRQNCACHPSQALKTRHWNYHLRFLCVFHITKAEKVRYGQPSMMRSSFCLTESCDTFCDKLFWEDTSPTLNINMFVFSKYVLAFTHKHCMYI